MGKPLRRCDTKPESAKRAAGIDLNWPVTATDDSESPLRLSHLSMLRLAIREIVSNVIRHAGARKVDITVNETHGLLHATIVDDGAGIDPTQVSGTPNGYGLCTDSARRRRKRNRYHPPIGCRHSHRNHDFARRRVMHTIPAQLLHQPWRPLAFNVTVVTRVAPRIDPSQHIHSVSIMSSPRNPGEPATSSGSRRSARGTRAWLVQTVTQAFKDAERLLKHRPALY